MAPKLQRRQLSPALTPSYAAGTSGRLRFPPFPHKGLPSIPTQPPGRPLEPFDPPPHLPPQIGETHRSPLTTKTHRFVTRLPKYLPRRLGRQDPGGVERGGLRRRKKKRRETRSGWISKTGKARKGSGRPFERALFFPREPSGADLHDSSPAEKKARPSGRLARGQR